MMINHESNEQDPYVLPGHVQFAIESLELIDIPDEYEMILRQLAGHPNRLGGDRLVGDEVAWLRKAAEYLGYLDNCLEALSQNPEYLTLSWLSLIEPKQQRVNELSEIIAGRQTSENIRENMEGFHDLFEGDELRFGRERVMGLISETAQPTADGE